MSDFKIRKNCSVLSAFLKPPHKSVELKDVGGIVQISEADKTSAGKVIAEAAIGGRLFGCFVGLLAGNIENRISKERNV